MIKRYILVAAGEDTFTAIYQKNKFIRESDYVIAVDGGLKVLEKNNIKPSLCYVYINILYIMCSRNYMKFLEI